MCLRVDPIGHELWLDQGFAKDSRPVDFTPDRNEEWGGGRREYERIAAHMDILVALVQWHRWTAWNVVRVDSDPVDVGHHLSRIAIVRGAKLIPSVEEEGVEGLAGNVWEWAWDCYTADYHDTLADPATDPMYEHEQCTGPTRRGGSYQSSPFGCRAVTRAKEPYAKKIPALGFRPARTIPSP